jgi:AcrR family transcriptional regulator
MPKLPPALAKGTVGAERISPEDHAEERRREILGLVTAVFAKRGYHGATIDHLVAGGRTSMGGFYKLFKGKEDCFVQAFDLLVEEAEEDARSAAADAEDWGERVAVGLRSLLEFIATRPFAGRLVLIEAQSGGSDAVRHYNQLMTGAAAILRVGRSTPTAATDLPDSFEEATVSGVAWLIQNRLARGETIDADRLQPQLVKMVLEPYLGRKELARLLVRSESAR